MRISNRQNQDVALSHFESSIRAALLAARGNERIRRHLGDVVRDRDRFDEILKAFGPSHAHVLDLLAIARHDHSRRVDDPRLNELRLAPAARHARSLLPVQR